MLQSSCLQSVSIGWDGGVYVQTCGHTLHVDCHKSYMESLRVNCNEEISLYARTADNVGTHVCLFVCGFLLPPQNDQVLQGFSVDKGEFTCPLCRQFANSVLPCRPGRDVEAGAWHAPTNKKMVLLVKEVEDLQERIGLFPVRLSTREQIEHDSSNVSAVGVVSHNFRIKISNCI